MKETAVALSAEERDHLSRQLHLGDGLLSWLSRDLGTVAVILLIVIAIWVVSVYAHVLGPAAG